MPKKVNYWDPQGQEQQGWYDQGKIYKDEGMTQRIDKGSTFKNSKGQVYQMGDWGGNKIYNPTQTDKNGNWVPTGNDWYRQAQQLAGQIQNRGPFSIDLNTDAVYQQIKDNYMKQGQQAMMDTMGQAAGLTGGYGSSYGQAVGNQAYNEYLTKLGDLTGEYVADARAAWEKEGDDLYNRMNMAMGMYDTDYQNWRNQVADQRYADELAYARERDAIADQRYADELAWDRDWQQRQWDYSTGRDALADQRYADELAYSRDRDALSDRRYADELAYARDRDAASDRRYADQQEYERYRDQVSDQRYADQQAYERERDLISDQRYADELAYKRQQTERDDARDLAMTMIQMGRAPSDAQLAAAGLDADTARFMANYYYSQNTAKYYGGSGGSGRSGGGSGGGSGGSGGSGGGTEADPYSGPDAAVDWSAFDPGSDSEIQRFATIAANRGGDMDAVADLLMDYIDPNDGPSKKAYNDAYTWIKKHWKEYIRRYGSGSGASAGTQSGRGNRWVYVET